jgi:hypothetical protein
MDGLNLCAIASVLLEEPQNFDQLIFTKPITRKRSFVHLNSKGDPPMLENRILGRFKVFNSILMVSLVIGLMGAIKPTSAQQNGTTCPEYYHNGDHIMTLTLDATCDANGDPRMANYPGYGPRDACYSSGEGYGLTDVCELCPPEWPNCTPCPDWEPECGEDTPDPPPDGSIKPRRNFFDTLWAALDWLTA